MAQVAVTLAQAKTGFQRAHRAALAAEPLCQPIFERWKAEMLAAGSAASRRKSAPPWLGGWQSRSKCCLTGNFGRTASLDSPGRLD